MQPLGHLYIRFHTFVTVLLLGQHALAQSAALVECLQLGDSSSIFVPENCTWSSTLPAEARLSITGARPSPGLYSSETATPVVVYSAAAGNPQPTASTTGTRLHLERLVLVGFGISPPDAASPQPLLWPQGITAGSGQALNMTDVRVIIDSQDLFNKYLTFFTSQNVLLWTDNTNFLHIKQWSDSSGRTQLRSVGLLVASPGFAAGPAPTVNNCLLLTTNTTLLQALRPHAAVATPLPLLVYLTSNVTIGLHPPLPTYGVLVKRPVIFVGLQSLVTSIDFEMVVNQLNLTGSPYSNVTFVATALENLAPGDTITSAVAAPFSIAVSNNLWSVFYNRSTPNEVRWALNNVTLVLPQDSEMSYVTYMLTLYNSPLQYLKAQTQFYSDVLHISMLQFQPGPGNQAITVVHLYSWFHRWGDVILTTKPQVAKVLPLPSRPLPAITSTTRASPLVQAVRTGDELVSFAEQPVVGDREHILLFLANVSLVPHPAAGAPGPAGSNGRGKQPLELASAMSWVGYRQNGHSHNGRTLIGEPAAGKAAVSVEDRVFLDCGFKADSVVIPAALPKDALQLQQLVLSHLPQGPGAMVPTTFKDVPNTLFTVLLWSFTRGHGEQSLQLLDVRLLLPPPELDYFKAIAENTKTFVVEMSGVSPQAGFPAGQRADAITFENAYQQNDALWVGTLTGPGFKATNVTLGNDMDAVAAMPGGYQWPDPSLLRLPAAPAGHPAWVTAVVAVCVTLAVLLLGLGALVWWQRKRICRRNPEAGQAYVSESRQSKAPSRGSFASGASRNHSAGLPSDVDYSHSPPCTSTTPCASCAAVSLGRGSDCTDVHMPLVEGGLKPSPRTARKIIPGSAVLAAAAAATASAAGTGAANAGELAGAGSPSSTGTPGGKRSGQDVLSQRDASPYSSSAEAEGGNSLQDNVAAGMQRWRAAVSSTTMLLMERRMDAAAALPPPESSSACTRTSSLGATGAEGQAAMQQQAGPAVQPPDADGGPGSVGNSAAAMPQQLQLQELLGQGSFGSVFLALWRGKRVAVKVMQLPAAALLNPGEQLTSEHNAQSTQQGQDGQQQQQDEPAQEWRRRLQRQKQQNSPPHMAIMEAVVSSTMCHPNVVQVYTYMLSPLTSNTDSSGKGNTGNGHAPAGGSSGGQDIAGWSLKLVMEYCDQGSLRDALDCGLLAKPGGFLAPSTVLALAHDVAAAMLHLHSEGIVHGDLKAGNVMLTSSSAANTGALPSVRMWAAPPGTPPLTAKVADFGLALPLAPSDTHATLLARGTPSHMSPELFMAGHVSKASDVYAYGVLLYEVITSRRAYVGIPVPLLPHEVAVKGLRPEWPEGLPVGSRDLKKLAQACWAQKPQERPTFTEILQTLDIWSAGGHGWPAVAPAARMQPRPREPPAQLQVQQQGQPSQQQQQAAVIVSPLTGPSQQAQQQQPLQQPPLQQKVFAAEAVNCVLQQDLQQRQLPPQQQQQQAQQGRETTQQHQEQSAREGAGRNMHMSWSEVDVNDGCHH